MPLVLVEFNSDWADEFTATGFDIMRLEDWQKMAERLERPVTWYFGTNEGWEDEMMNDCFTVKPISPEDADIIYRYFPELKREERSYEYEGETRTYMSGSSFGQFPDHLKPDSHWYDADEENDDA